MLTTMSTVRDMFTPGNYVDGVVSYVEGPEKFYVQPLDTAKEIRHVTNCMQVLYGTDLLSENDNTITLDYLNQCFRGNQMCLCAAPFHVPTPPDSPPIPTLYYRAVVIGRASAATVQVFFVDYGNTSVVPIASLKSLPQSLGQLPFMAVPCRLVECEYNELDGKAFRAMVDGYHVVVFVSPDHPCNTDMVGSEPLPVSVYMTDGKEEVNVAQEVIIHMQRGQIGVN